MGSGAGFITSSLARKCLRWTRIARLLPARTQLVEECLDVAPDRAQLLARLRGVERAAVLGLSLSGIDARALQLLLRPGDREALAIEKLAHPHQVLDVAARVHALALRALGRPDAAKLSLPVAQHVGLHPHQLG